MQSYKHVTKCLQVKITTAQKICNKDRCRPTHSGRNWRAKFLQQMTNVRRILLTV